MSLFTTTLAYTINHEDAVLYKFGLHFLFLYQISASTTPKELVLLTSADKLSKRRVHPRRKLGGHYFQETRKA
jgi:hypothetical protein